MSYRLEPGEPIEEGVQRLARERVDRALEALATEHDAAVAGVHDARKRFKEVRALLRLVRDPLGKTFPAENRCYRDLGRRLSGARDAEATVETFERLVGHFPNALSEAEREAARAALTARLERNGRAVPETVNEVCAELHAARERIGHWTPDATGFDALASGLRKTYRDGRRQRDVAYAHRTDEAFHEWRKRIKDHWYHIKLLRGSWAPVMTARQDQLKALSNLIGTDHDMAVLRRTLSDEPGMLGDRALGMRVRELAGQAQAALRAQAEPLGRRIYAEKPGALVKRLRVYWTVSQSAGESDS